jgi:hypothetical protein
VRLGERGRLGRQPRLADPGRAREDDAARRAGRQHLSDEPELRVAPGERPGHGASVIDGPPGAKAGDEQ